MEVSPSPAFVGEPTQLLLISNIARPQILQLPEIEGIRWIGGVSSRQETSIINLKQSTRYISIYTFIPQKEGKIQIPPIKVDLNKKKVLTDALEVDVLSKSFNIGGGNRDNAAKGKGEKQQKSAKIEDMLFLKAIPLISKKYLYVGEEIPFEVRLYSLNGLTVNCSWPGISLGNVVFRDYSKINNQNAQFEPVQSFSEEVKGQIFNINDFRTALRPISPGNLSGKVRIETVVKVPSQNTRRERTRNPFDDGFFNNLDDFLSPFGGNYEQYNYELSDKIEDITVKELPPVPQNSYFLGLVGVWNVGVESDQEKIKVGDPFSLKIKIKGQGTLDTLKAPEFQLNGFRIYPPEMDKKSGLQGKTDTAEIRYVLIPLEEGPSEINFTVSYFSTKEEKYIEIPFNRKFKVGKSEGISQQQIVSDASSKLLSPSGEKPAPKSKFDGIIYHLKKNPCGPVLLPLWKNHIYSILALIFLGIIIPAAGEFYYFKEALLSGDPVLMRKMNARRRKGRVIREIRKSNPENIHGIIRNEVLPYLNDSLGVPPGTSVSELCEQLENKELVTCLKEGEAGSYMPGASKDPSELKNKLIKIIKSGSFLLMFTLTVFFAGAVSMDAAEPPPAGNDNPLSAYNSGDFKKAAEYYRSRIDMRKPDPAYLYNLANCLYQLGELPQALVLYESAIRLSPRDSDIRENLNFVRRKLMQPEIGKAENPLDFLKNIRDLLRPDEWLFLSALFWFAAGITFAFRRKTEPRKVFSIIAVFAALIMICLIAFFSQKVSTYNDSIGFIVEKNSPVYQLPSENSNRAEFRLNGGEEVSIEEQNDGWSRIRIGTAEGWVKSNVLEKLWH